MDPQPEKSSQPARPTAQFAAAFLRRPIRAPRGLIPGRRVRVVLGWTAGASAAVALTVSLAASGVFGSAGHASAGAKAAPPPAPQVSSAPPLTGTAAAAVALVAARQPGRHICYRAFVEGTGWQNPVCDGATAGTVGQSRKLKSLDIAVSGTKGTGADAYLYKDHTKTAWNNGADGTDVYLGSTAEDHPCLLAFDLNVGDGAICANSHVHHKGWLGKACGRPHGETAGNLVFGGTLDDSLWLEAVQLTV